MSKARIQNLLLVSTLFILPSCGVIINSYIRKDPDNVPPDFGKEKTTLLVVRERNGYNKKVDKMVKKYYSGDYLFVNRDELKTKYRDTLTYRYVIDDQISLSKVTTTSPIPVGPRAAQPSNQTVTTGSRSFHILDRKTKKIDDTGVSSGTSWKNIMKAYLKKLDSDRKKNDGN